MLKGYSDYVPGFFLGLLKRGSAMKNGEKKVLWSMSEGVSERCIIYSTVLHQETPIGVARWMPRNLFRGG